MTKPKENPTAQGPWWLLVWFLTLPPLFFPEASAAQRTVRRVSKQVSASGESAGLFVGVRKFDDEQNFAEVPFAVDDAIDLAHLFAEELGLIEPRNVVLSLSGEPQKEESEARLTALLDAGARRESATQSEIYRLLWDLGQETDEKGLFVVALATHGFSEGGDFLVASDSVRTRLARTAVALEELLEEVAQARTPRRLVLLDACRERLSTHRGVGPGPETATSASFAAALAQARGQAVLSATTHGGYSYDDFNVRNGVFTSGVLAGLRGEAPADERGFITVRTLGSFLDDWVTDWVRRERPGHADLSLGIGRRTDGPADEIPLAVVLSNGDPWRDPVLGMTFSYVAPQEFRMGSPVSESGRDQDEIRHRVSLTRGFRISRTEVTRAQFAQFVRETGYRTEAERNGWSWIWGRKGWDRLDGGSWKETGTPDHPVVHVSWNDGREFCAWLGHKLRTEVRLPTEAEWELAARAGTETATYTGDLTIRGPCDAPELDPVAWYCGNSEFTAHPVGGKEPNAWGLHDMLGNVWEWVEDAADWNAETEDVETRTYGEDEVDPQSSKGSQRVIRGGSWDNSASVCRAAARYSFPPEGGNEILGFRVVAEVPDS